MPKKGKVKGIGSPFNLDFSSCSNNKPKLFDWSNEDSDFSVFMDYSILDCYKYPKIKNIPKFGWLCESITIFQNLYDKIKYDYKKIFNDIDYIFTSDEHLLSLDSRFKFCYSCSNIPWSKKENWNIYKKTKKCSMICSNKLSCNLHLLRQNIAKNNVEKFDLFGGFLNSPYTSEKYNDFYNKDNALKDYMFTVVIQNNNQPYFFAEMLTDCFSFGTIPIYLGNPKIDLFFDSNGIISISSEEDLNKIVLSEELYWSKFDGVKNNFEKLQTMQMSDDYLYQQCLKFMEV